MQEILRFSGNNNYLINIPSSPDGHKDVAGAVINLEILRIMWLYILNWHLVQM